MRSFTLEDLKKSKCADKNIHLFNAITKTKKSKYNNQKVEIDGFKFDSKAEARHYIYLRQLQTIGEIYGLKHHEVFKLSVCNYESDFTYYTKAVEYKVIDVKGVKTASYILKKKLMKSELGIEITEVK